MPRTPQHCRVEGALQHFRSTKARGRDVPGSVLPTATVSARRGGGSSGAPDFQPACLVEDYVYTTELQMTRSPPHSRSMPWSPGHRVRYRADGRMGRLALTDSGDWRVPLWMNREYRVSRKWRPAQRCRRDGWYPVRRYIDSAPRRPVEGWPHRQPRGGNARLQIIASKVNY